MSERSTPTSLSAPGEGIDDRDREGFYKVLYGRRDIRSQFRPDPVPEGTLLRVLEAAHHAPSVGFMQPWNFLIVQDRKVRSAIREDFEKVRAEGSQMFEGTRRELYDSLKLEGILDAPLNVCVTCDPDRAGPAVLGRVRIRDVDLYSTCCAIQNLWLAARAEGLGIGWVSILDPQRLRELLGIPERVVPVAYLTLGWVTGFPPRPELETKGWGRRRALRDLVFGERWGAPYALPPSPVSERPG